MSAAASSAGRWQIVGLLGWIAFAALFVYVIFIGGGYQGTLTGSLRMVSLAMISVALVGWAILALRRPHWRPRSAIWPALALPLIALTVASLASPWPRLGLEYVAWATLLVSLYLFLTRILATEFARARIGGLMAILGFVVGGAYVAVVVQRWMEWWGLIGELRAPMLRPDYAGLTFGGPTAVATVMVLLTAGAWAGLGTGTRGRQLVLAGLTVLAGVVVFVTGARTAWLATALALVVTAALWAIRHRDHVRGLLRDRRVLLLAAGLGAIVLVGVLVFGRGLASRLDFSSDGGRTQYLTVASRMFDGSPVLGQGPGTWASKRITFTQAGEHDIYISHAHNIYAQTAAESGLLGLAVGAVAVAALLWLIRGGLRDAGEERRRYGLGALFVLVYFGVYFLLDTYVDMPLAYLLAAIPFALLDGTAQTAIGGDAWDRARALRLTRKAAAVGLFVLAFGAALALWRVEAISSTNDAAIAAVDRGAWGEAVELATSAAAVDPAMTPYQLTLGLAQAGAGDWDAAEDAFEAVARTDDLPEAWLDLALARMHTGGDEIGVVEAIVRSLRIGSQHPSIMLAAADLYDRLGMSDRASTLLIELVAREPSLAADPALRSAHGDPSRFTTVTQEAEKLTSSAWEIALMSGDAGRAMELAREGGGPSYAPDVVAAWEGDQAAIARVRESALASPDDRSLVEWASRVAAQNQDREGAARFRRLADFGSEDIGVRGYELRTVPLGTVPPPGASVVANYHMLKGYRRLTPANALALGLPLLVQVDVSADATR